jgi:hypothetical protein
LPLLGGVDFARIPDRCHPLSGSRVAGDALPLRMTPDRAGGGFRILEDKPLAFSGARGDLIPRRGSPGD